MQCPLSLYNPNQFMSRKAEIMAIPATTIQVLLVISIHLQTTIILLHLRLTDLVLRVTCMTETNQWWSHRISSSSKIIVIMEVGLIVNMEVELVFAGAAVSSSTGHPMLTVRVLNITAVTTVQDFTLRTSAQYVNFTYLIRWLFFWKNNVLYLLYMLLYFALL